jgi:DNA-binding beta-propeller fold protein YncE
MYIAGSTNDSVYEYNLSTAWDVSTSSYSQTLAITPANSNNPKGVFFKPDGSKLFVATSSNFAKVNEYLVGQKRFDVSSQEVTPNGISFSSNGKKMFIVGSDGDDVNEYSLSTAFEITSASYSQSFSLSPVSIPTGIFFKPDGTKMYITNNSDDRVWQYELSTAYDISTASYSSKYFDFTFWESTPYNIYIGSYGTKLYLVGTSGDDVNEFDLSTAWDISTASFVQNFSVSSKESSPTGISFVPDGTGMYIAGAGSDDVNEYYLSTAWDISTATHVKTFNINSQGSAPTGLFFKPDGTRFFVVGNNSDSVTQYVIR